MSEWLAGKGERRWALILAMVAIAVLIGAILWPPSAPPSRSAASFHLPPKPKNPAQAPPQAARPAPQADASRAPSAGEKKPFEAEESPPEGFYVQLGAFRDIAKAQALVARLHGWSPTITRKADGMHAVRTGPWPTRQEAQAALKRLQREIGQLGFLVETGDD